MPAGKPAAPLSEQFGFDAEWRGAQLQLIGLDTCRREHVQLLHARVLTPDAAQSIIERFYEQLLQHGQAAELLSSFDVNHLKARQIRFLGDFGRSFKDAQYFESRASLGVVHARVGVPLSLYVASVGLMQSLILELVLERIDEREERRLLTELVVKLASLDIALATEVYHRARIEDMDRSLRTLEHLQQDLREQLEHDALTGASSRASLLRELAAAMERAAKTGQPLVVVMADLDHFKAVNDAQGHLVGDRVLADVSARIRAALREFDLVGRYGGEEFVILLENTSLHTARQVAERIRRRISAEPVEAGGVSVDITISQGLAMYRSGDGVSALLRRADQAMYRAKEAGRNCVVED